MADFWRLTPRELDAFHRRHAQAQERKDHLVGILASAIVNSGFCRPTKPVLPEDFGLGPRAAKTRPQASAGFSEQDVAEQWRGFFRGMGAKPQPKEPGAADVDVS